MGLEYSPAGQFAKVAKHRRGSRPRTGRTGFYGPAQRGTACTSNSTAVDAKLKGAEESSHSRVRNTTLEQTGASLGAKPRSIRTFLGAMTIIVPSDAPPIVRNSEA